MNRKAYYRECVRLTPLRFWRHNGRTVVVLDCPKWKMRKYDPPLVLLPMRTVLYTNVVE